MIKVTPQTLIWARKRKECKIEDLPQHLKEKVLLWEAGELELEPTWDEIRELSRVYKIPSAFFCMKEPHKYSTFEVLCEDLITPEKYNKETIINDLADKYCFNEFYIQNNELYFSFKNIIDADTFIHLLTVCKSYYDVIHISEDIYIQNGG